MFDAKSVQIKFIFELCFDVDKPKINKNVGVKTVDLKLLTINSMYVQSHRFTSILFNSKYNRRTIEIFKSLSLPQWKDLSIVLNQHKK